MPGQNQEGIDIYAKLKKFPYIVCDFFGLPWVEMFCGKEIAAKISDRRKLSPAKVIEFRERLRNFYSIIFSKYDIGLPSLDASKSGFDLREWFIIPDIVEKRNITEVVPNKDDSEVMDNFAPDHLHSDDGFSKERQRTVTRTIETRIDLQLVLTGNDRHIILG